MKLRYLIFLLLLAFNSAKYLTFQQAMGKERENFLRKRRRVKLLKNRKQREIVRKRKNFNEKEVKRKLQIGHPNVNPDIFCDLSVRVYPLLFRSNIGNLEFRVHFLSTCLRDSILHFFTLNSNRIQFLTAIAHPTFVQLNVGGRNFNFKFGNPFVRGHGHNANIAYRFVRVFPASRIVNTNTFVNNAISLNPRNRLVYRRSMLLNQMNSGLSFCNLVENDSIMNCHIAQDSS